MMKISLGKPATDLNPDAIAILALPGEKQVMLHLDLNRPSQRYMFDIFSAGGCYELETVAALVETLKPGDVFFDCGAHVGLFSAIAKALGAEVLAFEANFDNIRQFRKNAPEADIRYIVLDSEPGWSEFFVNVDNDGGHALWDPALHPHNERCREQPNHCRRQTMKLDQFARHKPNVIKIDTEGAEMRILKGATEILQQPQLRLVIAEANEFGLEQLGSNVDEMISFMARYGFTPLQPLEHGDSIENIHFTRS